jgi:hypothetical protein
VVRYKLVETIADEVCWRYTISLDETDREIPVYCVSGAGGALVLLGLGPGIGRALDFHIPREIIETFANLARSSGAGGHHRHHHH